jgi:hypothetical protein
MRKQDLDALVPELFNVCACRTNLPNGFFQVVSFYRLGEKRLTDQTNAIKRVRLAVRGNKYKWSGSSGADFLDGHVAVHFWHPNVGNDQVRILFTALFDELATIGRRRCDLMSHTREYALKIVAHVRLVVGYHDSQCSSHGSKTHK